MAKNAVVIVAAGRGERFGAEKGPKQYRQLGGTSILSRTVACFAQYPLIDMIQVVIHQDDESLYSESIRQHEKLLPPVYGGATRQASCRAGLLALSDEVEKVLIHDAARPFVSEILIENVVKGIKRNGCSLPALAIADTIKRGDKNGLVSATVPRDNLFLAQTPQGFRLDDIKAAHQRAGKECEDEFTDDAAVAEWAGMEVHLVEGDRDNFKITTKQDMHTAETQVSRMNTAMSDIRTGSGYDVHSLGPGKGVVLCGVEVPHSQSLQGHSDADVGLHALTDALLGTIGDGDIGSHFPPSDPKWQGASSDRFLDHAIKLVNEAGGRVTNLDVTLICEAPKIGPYRNAMRESVSGICGIELSRISVKATTNEKIGFIGRGEGIAALATATVCFGSLRDV